MADAEEEKSYPPQDEQQTREGKEAAAALDKVTDVVEEKEIKAADTSKVQQAMSRLAAQQEAEKEAKRMRDKELAAVKVKDCDIDVISKEFEVTKKQAELELRLSHGDLKTALTRLVSS